jgi:ABC-2 type transport system permease protein
VKGFATTVLMGLRMYLRDRGAVFWGIAFPLILMTLIGLAFGRSGTPTYSVAVVDHDAGLLGQGLVAGLRGVPVFSIAEVSDTDTALTQLRQGRLTLVVVLPPVGSGDPVQAYFDQSRSTDGQTALVILERFVAEANLRLAGAAPTVRVHATGVAGRVQLRFLDFLLPGILALTVMQTGLSGVTYVVTTYRQRLILKRILATPAHPAAFLGGLVGRYTLTGLFQMAVIIAVAVLVFHAKIVGNLATLTALTVVGTLAFVGMGFAISTVSSTPESANLLGSAISFPMMFLAGSFWPREFMGSAFQPVIGLLPLTPLVDAMRAVSARGEALAPYLPGLAYLAAWGAISFVLAARRFRWD